MAFPPLPNALVRYLDLPPWGPGLPVVLVDEVPVFEMKDYASLLEPESTAFNKGPMVRWIMDGPKGMEVFSLRPLPRHDDPHPGYFTVYGEGLLINCYQCLYAQPIVFTDGDTFGVKYWYLFLRQVRPVSIDPEPEFAPPGADDPGEADEVSIENPLVFHVDKTRPEMWWKLPGLSLYQSFLGDVYWGPGLEAVEVNLYYGDPPGVPTETYLAPGNVNSPVLDPVAYLQITNPDSEEGLVYWNAYPQDSCITPTTSTTWAGASLLGLSQWYCMTFNPGDAFYFKFPALDGAGFNFTVETIVEGNDPMIQTFAMDNGSPPTNTFWSYNGTGSNSGTTTGAPFGIQVTSMATRMVHFRVTSP